MALPFAFVAYALGLAVLVWSLDGTGWSISELATGLPALADFFSRAFPPSLERLPSLSTALVETFQMASLAPPSAR